jgi:hypothetical protein
MKDEAKTDVNLKYPVKIEGAEVAILHMRRPKVRDLRAAAAKSGAVDQEITLFSNLCEVPPTAIEDLDVADYTQLQTAYQGFRG